LKFCPKEGALLQAHDAASLGKRLPAFRKIIFLATCRVCRSEEVFNLDGIFSDVVTFTLYAKNKFHNLATRWKAHTPTTLPHERTQYEFDRGMGGPCSLSRRFGVNRKLLLLPRKNRALRTSSP
jgi:hypothetical protein